MVNSLSLTRFRKLSLKCANEDFSCYCLIHLKTVCCVKVCPFVAHQFFFESNYDDFCASAKSIRSFYFLCSALAIDASILDFSMAAFAMSSSALSFS